MQQWEVTFEGVGSPQEMKQKLEASPFFRRCAVPKSITITEDHVVLTFMAALARQDVVKKCTQTFRTYGSY